MTIHLTKELQQFVRGAVEAGLYAREDDVVRDALLRLKQTMPKKAPKRAAKTKRTKTAGSTKKKATKRPMTEAEFDRLLMRKGLMIRPPDTEADFDDPSDEPITIKGEPLSETVIRERR